MKTLAANSALFDAQNAGNRISALLDFKCFWGGGRERGGGGTCLFSGHIRLLHLQWPLKTNVIETPVVDLLCTCSSALNEILFNNYVMSSRLLSRIEIESGKSNCFSKKVQVAQKLSFYNNTLTLYFVSKHNVKKNTIL